MRNLGFYGFQPSEDHLTNYAIKNHTDIENGFLKPVDQCLPILRPDSIELVIGKENQASHYDLGGKTVELTAQGFSCSGQL